MRSPTRTIAALLLILVAGASLAPLAVAEGNGAAARVALQMVGRNQVTGLTGPGAGTAISIGYLTAIDGINQPLFASPAASEATAHFTFRTEDYGFSTIVNGNTQIRVRTPGAILRIYYQAKPGASFGNVSSFSNGALVAVLRLAASQATRVENGATSVDALEFVSASAFEFGGRRHNLRQLLKNGITLHIAGAALPVGASGVEAAQFAFSGTGVRVGSGDD